MDQNEDIFKKIMDNKGFRKIVEDYLMKRVYHRLQQENNNQKYILEAGSSFAVAEKPAKYKIKK
jgi:hypothetical protein